MVLKRITKLKMFQMCYITGDSFSCVCLLFKVHKQMMHFKQ